jgi:putative intracellular protease/amidase
MRAPVRVAVQKATWDVMHEKLVTPGFLSWLESACPGTSIKAVSDEDILDRALDWFDAVFYPGSIGSALAVEKYGESYRATVRDFVRRGGCYIGVCGGCYVAAREFRLRHAAREAAGGVVRKPGAVRGAVKDISGFDRAISRKTGRAAAPRMAAALLRGKMKTFDLLDAVAVASGFFGDPDFIRDRWSRMVTDGNLLSVTMSISVTPHAVTEGHQGESVASSYSGGPLLESLHRSVVPLATYASCETLPEADGKVALAIARHGDGIVIVSGPDFYLPFEAEPGMCVRDGMEPSVPWLTRRVIGGHMNYRRVG